MAGLDRTTGRLMLSGWAHTVQSIGDIVTTVIGSRCEQRLYGCDEGVIQDRPSTESEVLRAFTAIAVALNRWEPRFRLLRVVIKDTTVLGRLVLGISGIYYPRGHHGDWSVVEVKDFEVAT